MAFTYEQAYLLGLVIVTIMLTSALYLVSSGLVKALDLNLPIRYYIGIGILSGMIILLAHPPAKAVDMDAVKHIESRGNPRAVSEAGAIGLYQVMPITLKSYNQRHKRDYTKEDLFNGDVNEKIADWYLHTRIPEMLRYYDIKVNDYNVLWAYNAGIGRVRQGVMPEETKGYIRKYQRITGR